MKKPLVLLTVSMAVFLAVSALFLTGALERLELLTVDLRYRLISAKDPPEKLPVVVVTLDQNSIKGLARWPIGRENYGMVLDKIISDGAIGVLVDVDFSSKGPDPRHDMEFAAFVKSAENIVMAALMDERTNPEGALIRNISVPYPDLRESVRVLGSITFKVDVDGVVRRMPPAIDNIGEVYLPLGVIGALMIDPSIDTQYPAASMMNMGVLAGGQLKAIPFLKVLQDDFPKGFFRDKVVLLGATSPDLHDFWLTPMGVTPGVLIQAAVLDTALNRSWFEQQTVASTLVLLFLVCLITGWIMGESGWKGGVAILLLFVATTILSSLLAAGQGVFLQMVPILLTCLVMYPAQVAVRARTTDLILAQERMKTEAFLSIPELQTAEEKGQETYLAPLVLLGKFLELTRITVCLTDSISGSEIEFRTVTGDSRPDPPMDEVRQVIESRVCVTITSAVGKKGILVPLATVRKVLGALYIESDQAVGEEEEEIRLLMSFATQTAYFLESHALDLRVKELYVNTIRAISRALDSKDQYTSAHSELSTDHVERFGQKCGLGREQIESLHVGALLHDIGKIGVPDSILAKKDGLSGEEYDLIKDHPVIGSDIIRGLPFPDDVKMIIRHHHERFDGTGYPDGLKGDEIPVLVRIFSILDVYEALVGFRPYRTPLDPQSAVNVLREGSGTQFDPELVELFLSAVITLDAE